MYKIHYGDVVEEYDSLKDMFEAGGGISVACKSYTANVVGYPVYITKDDEVIAIIDGDTVIQELLDELIKNGKADIPYFYRMLFGRKKIIRGEREKLKILAITPYTDVNKANKMISRFFKTEENPNGVMTSYEPLDFDESEMLELCDGTRTDNCCAKDLCEELTGKIVCKNLPYVDAYITPWELHEELVFVDSKEAWEEYKKYISSAIQCNYHLWLGVCEI